MKNYQKAAENAKINAVLNTREQLLVLDDNTGIRDWLKRFLYSSRDKHVDAQYLQIGASYNLCKLYNAKYWVHKSGHTCDT